MTILASVNNKTLMPGITPIADVPDAPTIGTATAGEASASVTFTASTTGGVPTTFTATSNPGSITGTGSSSPITVSGLNPGTSYTFTVTAGNSTGTSPASSASNSATPTNPIDGAYDSLASVLIGSTSVSSITFAGIPTGYKHLQIRALCLNTGQDTLNISYNGDTTGSNYRDHQAGGNASSRFAFSNAGVNGYGAGIGLTSQTVGAGNIIDILDYSSVTKNKTARSLWGVDRNGAGSVGIFSHLWISTQAINTITLSVGTYPFTQHSRFTLYGVK
jgi:hypothetical protein